MEPRAKRGVFKLVPGALHTVNVRFLPRQRIPLGARVFTLDLVQEAAGRVGGGQRFVLKTVPDYHGIAVETTPGAVFDGVDWVPVDGGTKGHGCCCK